MAKLEQLPEYNIILGLKGVVDFACWKGIYYARKWPRYTGYNNQPNVVKGNAPFGYIKQQAKTIDSPTTDALLAMIDDTQRVYTDEQVSLYYGYDVSFSWLTCFAEAFEDTAFDSCSFT